MKKAFETKFHLLREIKDKNQIKDINLGFAIDLSQIKFKTITNLEIAQEYLNDNIFMNND